MYSILIILAGLSLPTIAAFFLSLFVFNRTTKAGLKYPRTYQALTFIFSFLVIVGALVVLFIYNFSLQR